MKRVGILTFHNAHNYGAVLQCFALQTFLRSKGFDAIVINYKCKEFSESYKNGNLEISENLFKYFKNIVKYFLKGKRTKDRYNVFENFIQEYLKLSDDSTNHSYYEIIIFGSDQIWNSEITHDDYTFWGNVSNCGKRISYAASAGKYEDRISDKEVSYLQQFCKISVREKSLKDKLLKCGISDVIKVLDPTLLLTKKEWLSNLSISVSSNKQRYILLYALREQKRTSSVAKVISKKLNLPIIEISGNVSLIPNKHRIETAGPVQFVNFIKNADFIVTNSFHGTAFSIIFNKQFCCVKLNDGEDGRVGDLLKDLSLDKRHISSADELVLDRIDYISVEQLLNSMREQSYNFLMNNLSE